MNEEIQETKKVFFKVRMPIFSTLIQQRILNFSNSNQAREINKKNPKLKRESPTIFADYMMILKTLKVPQKKQKQ